MENIFKNIFGHYGNVTLYDSFGEVRYRYKNDEREVSEIYFDCNGVQKRRISKKLF